MILMCEDDLKEAFNEEMIWTDPCNYDEEDVLAPLAKLNKEL